jgi:hypothetical protein
MCAQWGANALGGEDVDGNAADPGRELDDAVQSEYEELIAVTPTFPAKGTQNFL